MVLAECDFDDKANVMAGTLARLDRKRLELARGLASKPKLLLLDEIAEGLPHAVVEDPEVKRVYAMFAVAPLLLSIPT